MARSHTSRPSTRAGSSRNNKPSSRSRAPKRKGWNYPRAGYGPIRRWLPSWRFVGAFFVCLIALGITAFASLYAMIKIPQPSDFALSERTTVYFDDGQTEIGSVAEYDRQPVSLAKMPENLTHAVVASEDKTFYTNNGIDLRGIARALISNVQGVRQGGSTLTQQYVERFYLGETVSYAGKVKEAILALKIDRTQSKEQVLENYLNTIYFGRGSYGVQVASQHYFGKNVEDLDLSESALLAAVIPAPSAWDPAVDQATSEKKWKRVLTRMVDDGYISQEEANSAVFPQTISPTAASAFNGTHGYLLQAVKDELISSGKFTEDQINMGGYKVISTIKKDYQQAAVDAVASLPEDRPANNHVGLVSADPKTGAIVALYGGKNYLDRQRNNATQDRAQAGSTFKPFALMAALERNIPLTKTYSAQSPMTIEGQRIENYGNISYGTRDLVGALELSLNTPFVQLNRDIGPSATHEVAVRAGIPENTPGLDDALTNVLGSTSPTPLEMVTAYGTFAANGVRHQMHIVDRVENSSGALAYIGPTEGERVFSEKNSALLTYAMQKVADVGLDAPARQAVNRPVAAKTGTSSGPVSAWICAFIPQLVTVVDMYQIGENGEEEVLTPFGGDNLMAGGGFPLKVWSNYMKVVTKDMPIEKFPTPKNMQTQESTQSPSTQNEEKTDQNESGNSTEQSPAAPTQETPDNSHSSQGQGQENSQGGQSNNGQNGNGQSAEDSGSQSGQGGTSGQGSSDGSTGGGQSDGQQGNTPPNNGNN